MKHVPNVISFIRILISIALIFLYDYKNVFLIGYLLCGISDIADGYIARRYKLETRFGEQMDSFSDAIFYWIVLYLLINHTDIMKYQWVTLSIVLIMMFKLINLIITKVKYKTWGSLHTWGNKGAGILLFLYMAVIFIYNTIILLPGLLICLIAFAVCIEEMAILLTTKEYNANQKSIFMK